MRFNIKEWQDKHLKEDKELIKYKAGQKYSKMIGGKLHQVEITKILPNGKFNGISKTLGSEPVRSKGNKIKNGTLTAWLDGYIKESQDKHLTKNPINEGVLATAGAITLGLLGLGLIRSTAKYAINSLSRQIGSNKNATEAKQVMEWMDKKYGDLFNNDNKLKSLIKTFVKFNEKTRLELNQIKKDGAPDETYSIIETPSFDARNKALFAIDNYIKKTITNKHGSEEVKKLNNTITSKLDKYRNELINVLTK